MPRSTRPYSDGRRPFWLASAARRWVDRRDGAIAAEPGQVTV
jgi:hypothetical protein